MSKQAEHHIHIRLAVDKAVYFLRGPSLACNQSYTSTLRTSRQVTSVPSLSHMKTGIPFLEYDEWLYIVSHFSSCCYGMPICDYRAYGKPKLKPLCWLAVGPYSVAEDDVHFLDFCCDTRIHS
eukprot:1812993-Pleurochrysis_carterae.AAC.1